MPARPRSAGAGESWEHGRYRGPYLRDALLDAGALVETLETVTFWSRVPDAVRGRLERAARFADAAGTPPVILCHVSHVYPAGASLYFTVACRARRRTRSHSGSQPRPPRATRSSPAGGSITHHHGVGTDHRDWYAREIGELGVDVLRAVKATLDPAGIMNPGVLLPLR